MPDTPIPSHHLTIPRLFIAIFFILPSCSTLERMPPEVVEAGLARARAQGDLMPLEEKAREFRERIAAHHITREGLLNFRTPFPYAIEVPPSPYADTGAWTSLWVASLVYEYRVTANPDIRPLLERSLRGLSHLARVSGEPGLLARAMVPAALNPAASDDVRVWRRGRGGHDGLNYDDYLWKTDNAKAQLVCWLLAVHLGLEELPDGPLRNDLREDLREVSYRIFKEDLNLTDAKGRPERYGDLHPAFRPPFTHFASCCWTLFSDQWPVWDLAIAPNALVSLSLARVHDSHVPGRSREAGLKDEGFDRVVAEGFYEVPGLPKYGNDNLSMLGILTLLESYPPRHLGDALEQGARRVWERHRYDRNSFFTLVALRAGAIDRHEIARRLAEALYSLQVFPRDRRIRETDARDLPGLQRRFWSRGRAQHPLPLNYLSSSSFVWKAEPSELRDYPGADGSTAHAPMDYLLAYWLYRSLQRDGLIPETP
ncbi:MAG: hypothetical protein AB7F75_05155 [Planctomycetota bacterium]